MDVEVVSKWTMSAIKEWLDQNEVPYSKADRKPDLVAAVIQSGIVSAATPGVPAQPSTPESHVYRVEPSKMKVHIVFALIGCLVIEAPIITSLLNVDRRLN